MTFQTTSYLSIMPLNFVIALTIISKLKIYLLVQFLSLKSFLGNFHIVQAHFLLLAYIPDDLSAFVLFFLDVWQTFKNPTLCFMSLGTLRHIMFLFPLCWLTIGVLVVLWHLHCIHNIKALTAFLVMYWLYMLIHRLDVWYYAYSIYVVYIAVFTHAR